MKKLVLLTTARQDLREIHRHLDEELEDYRVADSIVEQLVRQCEHLAELSGTLGRARPEFGPRIRSFPCRGYIIFFRYVEEQIEIVHIINGRRDLEGLLSDDE